MTPRALPDAPTGLRGPGQDIFPEEAKEQARRVGLVDGEVMVLKKESRDDGGGDITKHYTPQPPAVRGRIDALHTRGGGAMFGDKIDESTTHFVTVDADVDVDSNDQLEVAGQVWEITSEEFFTDEATTRIQVKEATT